MLLLHIMFSTTIIRATITSSTTQILLQLLVLLSSLLLDNVISTIISTIISTTKLNTQVLLLFGVAVAGGRYSDGRVWHSVVVV